MNKIEIRFAKESETEKILYFIKKIAEYEHMEDQVEATAETLRKSIFERREAEALFVSLDGKDVGFAVFFQNFSTFVGKAGIWLEDLYVLPEYRGKGCGEALFSYLAGVAKERGCKRFEWCCLNWNQPSIEFYRAHGAKPMSEWTTWRLSGKELDKLDKYGK